MKTYFLFFFLLFAGVQSYAGPPLETYRSGSGDLCVGESESFTSNNSSSAASYVWEVYRAVANSSGSYGNFSHVLTAVPQGNTPYSYTFNEPGLYRMLVSIPVPGGTPITVCSGCAAEVEVFGPIEPTFTVDNLGCSYDPLTQMYTSQISILPNVDRSTPSPTKLDIDWGDNNTETKTINLSTNHTPITHTYTTPYNSGGVFPISVTASSITGFHSCPQQTYTVYHSLVSEYYDIQFEVVEESCDRHVVCVTGIPPFTEVGLYGPNGEEGFFTECMEFWLPGPYYLVIPTPGGCPQVITYTATFGVNPGTLSSPDPSIMPGKPLNLNLTNPNNGYVAYEVLAETCYGTPDWLLFNYGPAASMNQFVMPAAWTNLIKPCFLTNDFEVCIRARVFCSEEEMFESYASNTFPNTSNTICLPLCMIDCETSGGGGNDDPPYDGDWLQGVDDTGTEQSLNQKETFDDTSIHIYPNPTSDQFFVEMDGYSKEASLTLQIIDIKGQIVRTINDVNPNGSVIDINLSEQPAGVYQVLISDGTKPIQTSAILKID